MEKYFLIPVMLLLMSAFVFASVGAGANAVNLTSARMTVSVSAGNGSANATHNKTRVRNNSEMLISPNPMAHHNATRAQEEMQLRECMKETVRKHANLSDAEARYYCARKLNLSFRHNGSEEPEFVAGCVANLSVGKNVSAERARMACYSKFINMSVKKGNLSGLRRMLNSSNDSNVRRMIKEGIAHTERAMENHSKSIHNMSKNKEEFKAQVKTMMKSEESRKALLSELKKDKKLLMNKTVLSAFMPEHINLSNAEILNATVKDNSSIVVKVRVRAKLFGFIPVPMTETIVNNGNVTVKRPFWSFLAKLG